jgi:two-component system, NtrC family, response regulator AtoC
MRNETIFVIDDEAHIRETIEEVLAKEGYRVRSFEDSATAVRVATKENPILVITDLVMPGMDGFEVIKALKNNNPEISIVVITGHASLHSAIEAIRAGASDYVVKPFKIQELLGSIKKALSHTRLMSPSPGQEKSLHERYKVKSLIGGTPEMQEIFKLITRVAKADSTVLVMGESGTGKEMVARAIHYHSSRKKKSFVSINCAALPETLLESELFGYEKGAFTGAQASKIGLFELAEGGSFFLDEVGEMSLNLQVKLLRVIQERNLRRLGGVKDVSVDFRLIAATSRNIPEEIKKGCFREDLYYRLNVIPIILPPLRERADDIPVFVCYFLNHFAKKEGKGRQFQLLKEALSVFQAYKWPGNIRELENVMERLVAVTDREEINAELAEKMLGQNTSFSSVFKQPIIGNTSNSNDLRQSVEMFEKELIEKAIQEAGGNKNRAARKLNLTRQALQYKLNKYRLAS